MKQGGVLVSTLSEPSQEKARSLGARGELYFSRPNAGELAAIGELIDAGKLTPHVHAVFPLASVREAQRELEQHHVRGKVVVEVAQA